MRNAPHNPSVEFGLVTVGIMCCLDRASQASLQLTLLDDICWAPGLPVAAIAILKLVRAVT